jgi:signal transduction histidine kinase
MSELRASQEAPVCGRVDKDGRLVAADPALAGLHARAGGEEGHALAIPQIAALARLARRLGIVISRSVIAADEDADLDLWVRAQPAGDDVELAITGWTRRPPRDPAPTPHAERESDFLRSTADWMWETDEALRLAHVSPAAAAAVGKLPSELIGKQLTRLFRFDEDEEGSLPILTALAEQRRFGGQPASLRGRARARYELAGVPLIDGNGRFAGFRGSATKVAASGRPAPASEMPQPSLGDTPAFGERLDRALRAPIDHIIANAETISAQPEGPLRRDYAGYANDIASAGRHLLALVDDLVDLQAIERADFTPDAEPLDLADVARRAAGLLAVRATEGKVRIDAPPADETMPATGEFKRALQILTNLVGNAVRYSPEGAMVWIRTEREEDLACVIVADQGKGIDPADQERIFEKFERVDPSEPGGTGLGLYIARRLARAMGGDIAIDSAPGQGARFTFTLPLRSAG